LDCALGRSGGSRNLCTRMDPHLTPETLQTLKIQKTYAASCLLESKLLVSKITKMEFCQVAIASNKNLLDT